MPSEEVSIGEDASEPRRAPDILESLAFGDDGRDAAGWQRSL
jgi:hypothetical protein